jgi:uncharacterized RDD family membrane protein YckC
MICRNHLDVAEGVRRCSRCGATFCRDCLVHIQGQPYCATCKNEQLLDVRSGVDRTQMSYATILKRFGAVVLDNIIQAIPIYAMMFGVLFATGAFNNPGGEPSLWVLLMYIPAFTIPIVYEGLMLSLKNGQTLGKMALHVRVVRPDGSPISNGQAWGRAAMRLVLSCLWIVDYIPAFFTNEKTTLHDLVVGTRVIEEY